MCWQRVKEVSTFIFLTLVVTFYVMLLRAAVRTKAYERIYNEKITVREAWDGK